MAQNKSAIYLARKGKVFGPFSESEYEGFHKSGEIDKYSWIWDSQILQWKPMDPAPLPLKLDTGSVHTQTFTPQLHSQPQPNLRIDVDKFIEARNIAAICHDYHHAIAGKIGDVTATGCELLSDEPYSSPPLCARSLVHLNLLDESTGKSVNVEARIFDIHKTHKGWMYRLSWDQTPALL